MQKVAENAIEASHSLHTELAQLRDLVKEKDQRIEQLLDYVLLLRKRQFGPRRDRVSKEQIQLFDEAELEQLLGDLPLPDPDASSKPKPSPKADTAKQPVRRPLPAHLNRVEKLIDLPEADKAAMGNDWQLIGYDTSEQLAIIPRQYYVIEYKRAKYVPVNDAVPGAEQGVRIAPRPEQMLPKSLAHSSVIADVVTRKFVDGLPFYRQEVIAQREQIDLNRKTMSSWVIQLSERLTPLMAALKHVIYQGRLIQIDETRLQVLKEPGRENTAQSYMWVFRGGPPDKPVIWFEYADTRSGEVPINFLLPEGNAPPGVNGFYIQTDGYAGYNALAATAVVDGHAACWAHVRRAFVEATQGRKNTAAAHQMVALIGQLYALERKAKDVTPEQRQVMREIHAQPILDKIKAWLDRTAPKALPKSPLGKAVHYTLGLWPQLCLYITNGHLPIDNNATENAIRPFVIGRKAFLFSGSPRGARASAMMYTLVETAKANGLEPWAYLNYLFEHLPAAKSEQAILDLLPQNLQMSDLHG